MGGWWGVDLDGTLASYGGWKGKSTIGEPLQPMVERIRNWLAQGKEVKIFTARVSRGSASAEEIAKEITFIQDWLERECKLPRLPVTAEKDYAMIELWDDRCIQVEFNTGVPKHGEPTERTR
jgi:hypothetical protein